MPTRPSLKETMVVWFSAQLLCYQATPKANVYLAECDFVLFPEPLQPPKVAFCRRR